MVAKARPSPNCTHKLDSKREAVPWLLPKGWEGWSEPLCEWQPRETGEAAGVGGQFLSLTLGAAPAAPARLPHLG